MAGIDGMTEPVVLYQGGFVPHRGLEPLVQAAALLERGVLVLMGWGRLEADLAALVRRKELSDRVKILPPVSQAELPRYTSGADVGVIPYEPVGLNNYFTTPNKLFEYIAAGLPVIASDLPELRKVLHGHRVGVTFERAEASEIAHALNSVLCEPALLAEMRANALAVRNEYTWERQALKLLEVYDDPGAGGSTPAVADLAGAER
jgi:glycosyltransferase involved in cell wall biosynthesis